jgi:hypothetical protein
MVIFQERVLWLFNPEFAGHAQMQSQPILAPIAESKYHLLAQPFRIEQPLAGQRSNEFLWIYAPKEARLSVAKNYFQDYCASSHRPKATAALDFSQLRHF